MRKFSTVVGRLANTRVVKKELIHYEETLLQDYFIKFVSRYEAICMTVTKKALL